MSEPQGKILFRWTPTAADRVTGFDILAEEYLVVEKQQALSGIVVHAKYHGEWVVNPWCSRPIVRELLRRLAEGREAAARLVEEYSKKFHMEKNARHILDLIAADLRKQP